MQTAYQILHTRCRQHTKACIQHTEIQHTKCRQHTKICIQHTNHFEIRNSGARKEPAAIPPNENASIVKATGERVNRKRSTGCAKPVLDPRGNSSTCGVPGRYKNMRELNHGEDGSCVRPGKGAGAYRGPITTENGSARESPNKGFCHQIVQGFRK